VLLSSLYFDSAAQLWLDLQSQYNVAIVEREHGAEIKERAHPKDAA
jgi:antitoxin HigA-1